MVVNERRLKFYGLVGLSGLICAYPKFVSKINFGYSEGGELIVILSTSALCTLVAALVAAKRMRCEISRLIAIHQEGARTQTTENSRSPLLYLGYILVFSSASLAIPRVIDIQIPGTAGFWFAIRVAFGLVSIYRVNRLFAKGTWVLAIGIVALLILSTRWDLIVFGTVIVLSITWKVLTKAVKWMPIRSYRLNPKWLMLFLWCAVGLSCGILISYDDNFLLQILPILSISICSLVFIQRQVKPLRRSLNVKTPSS